MSPEIGGVVFDLDGTLGDTLDICVEAFQTAIDRYTGVRPSADDVTGLWGPTEEGVLRAAVGEGWEEALPLFFAEYERLHVDRTEPFPGISALLDRLRTRGVPAAVVTGKGPVSTRISLDRFDIAGFFDVVEAGSIDGVVKADKILEIARRWGVLPRRLVYVGDSSIDVAEARRAGSMVVSAAWGDHVDAAGLQRLEPDALFLSVEAFSAWLEPRI